MIIGILLGVLITNIVWGFVYFHITKKERAARKWLKKITTEHIKVAKQQELVWNALWGKNE